MGPPFPYYSYTTPIRIPWSMGMVWEAYIGRGSHYSGVPKKVPKNKRWEKVQIELDRYSWYQVQLQNDTHTYTVHNYVYLFTCAPKNLYNICICTYVPLNKNTHLFTAVNWRAIHVNRLQGERWAVLTSVPLRWWEDVARVHWRLLCIQDDMFSLQIQRVH